MNQNNLNLNIILPTYNEEKNLEFIIPEILDLLKKRKYESCEITVVDDNSNDDTANVVKKLMKNNPNLFLIERKEENSLPLSIYDGIIHSTKENVMWLDSDGSMGIDAIDKLIQNFIKNKTIVYVGSRFVNEGGYKGQSTVKNKKSEFSVTAVSNSEDSILAIYLSLIFNKILEKVLNIGVKDLTSGFIVGKKVYFSEGMFRNFVYGEYFIKVVGDLYIQDIEIKEIGYFCKPRVYGFSKTSNNLLRLISLSKPYILSALSLRKDIRENLRQ
tara:strand:- start:115 stop:930 length:816 start_codon:yes stop_codon:yes gene_type:complete